MSQSRHFTQRTSKQISKKKKKSALELKVEHAILLSTFSSLSPFLLGLVSRPHGCLDSIISSYIQSSSDISLDLKFNLVKTNLILIDLHVPLQISLLTFPILSNPLKFSLTLPLLYLLYATC